MFARLRRFCRTHCRGGHVGFVNEDYHHIVRLRLHSHGKESAIWIVNSINAIVKRCLSGAPAFHWSSPISMCYVTTEAPALINTAISEISLTEDLHLFPSDTHTNVHLPGSGKSDMMQMCHRCRLKRIHII